MTKNNKNPLVEFFNAHRKGCIIGGAIALFLILGCISAAVSPVEPTDTSKKEEPKTTEKQKDQKEIMKTAAENLCESAAISITSRMAGKYDIYTLDANQTFTELGSYDKNGKPLYILNWNGKNKTLDMVISFSCVISGTNEEDATIQNLKLDSDTIYGDPNWMQYHQDGTPL